MKTFKRLLTALKIMWGVPLGFAILLIIAAMITKNMNIAEFGYAYWIFAVYVLYPLGILINILAIIFYIRAPQQERKAYRNTLIAFSVLFHLNLPVSYLCAIIGMGIYS